MHRSLLIATVLVLAQPIAADAAIVETEIAEEPGATLVATHGGWVVWSTYDPVGAGPSCPAIRAPCERWRLVGRAPGSQSITPFAIATRPMAFDVDLGPDDRGRTAAVYSRCQSEPRSVSGYWRYSRHRAGRGCRIVKLDLETGGETTLYRRKGQSLIYPTMWRNRLAYVARRRRPDDLRIELRVTRNGRTTTAELGRGPARRTEFPLAGPLRTDLRGKDLVFAWESQGDTCPSLSADDDAPTATRVFLQRGAQLRTLLDYGCAERTAPGAVLSAHSVTIAAGVVSWMRATYPTDSESSYSLRQRSLSTGKITDTPARGYASLTADRTAMYAQASALDPAASGYRIVRLALP